MSSFSGDHPLFVAPTADDDSSLQEEDKGSKNAASLWHDAYQKALARSPFGDNVTRAFEKIVEKPPRPDDPRERGVYEALLKDLHRMTDFNDNYPTATTAFGSARLDKTNPHYELAYDLGRRLAEETGRPVRTGAGPGIMDAVPAGYKKGKNGGDGSMPPTQGIRIELPFEPELSKNIDVNTYMKTFAIRRAALIWNSSGIVVLPGGFGTINELFQAWLAAIDEIVKCPIVLVPNDFYDPFMNAIMKVAVADRSLISEEYFQYVQRAENADEAVRYINQVNPEHTNKNQSQLMSTRENILRLRRELGRGLKIASNLPAAVTFVGGEGLKPDALEIAFAKSLAQNLAEENVALRVASRGVVDATIREAAARESGTPNVQRFFTTSHAADVVGTADASRDVDASFRSRVAHREVLIHNLRALIVLPSDLAGFDILFAIVCEMQCHHRKRRPIILLGKEFWGPIIEGLGETMGTDGQFISDGDLDLMTVVDAIPDNVMEVTKRILITPGSKG